MLSLIVILAAAIVISVAFHFTFVYRENAGKHVRITGRHSAKGL